LRDEAKAFELTQWQVIDGRLAGGTTGAAARLAALRLRGTLAAGVCSHLFHAARGATLVAILIMILIMVILIMPPTSLIMPPTSIAVLVVVTVSATAFGLGLCSRRFHRRISDTGRG
jgi:hypothetical protein